MKLTQKIWAGLGAIWMLISSFIPSFSTEAILTSIGFFTFAILADSKRIK